MAYRQLQIIVGLYDNCFQQFSWPNIQFMGSSIIISVLYSVLMFYKIYPAKILLMMVSTCTITGIFIFSISIMEVGPMLDHASLSQRVPISGGHFHGLEPSFEVVDLFILE